MKYLSNFDFNTDNFDQINNVVNSKNLDLHLNTTDHFNTLSRFNNNTNKQKIDILATKNTETQDKYEDNLKKFYEENQVKIEKALINKNLSYKDSVISKSNSLDY